MKTWIAGASMALATAMIPLAAEAQCDPQALVSSCTIASTAANASFLELMSNDTSGAAGVDSLLSQDPASDVEPAATHPAVYVGGQGTASFSQTSVAGVAGLASGADPSLAGRAVPGWLGLSSLPSQPAPSFAWVLAIGFLGLIVVRRTRATRGF